MVTSSEPWSRSFADWQLEMSSCMVASLCDIPAGQHGPVARMLEDRFNAVRSAMVEHMACLMIDQGYPVEDVLEAVRASMGFKA